MTEANESLPEPLITWNVPGIGEQEAIELSLHSGSTLVLVGPNGAGKSALSFWMSTNRRSFSTPVSRVVAHRRIWLNSSGSEITTSQRVQYEPSFVSYDSQAASRTTVQMENERSARVLHDLMARVNSRNARAAARYDSGRTASADDKIEENILSRVARIFAAASLDLEFEITEAGGIDANNWVQSSFPISQMSDGEKGAFLLAAEVLLAPERGVLLIDEPERHLHRSISSDFILALRRERPDAGFVLFTHDLNLIDKLDGASTVVGSVNAVEWLGENPTGWELRVEPDVPDVPDAVRHAILGGRTELLFIEGETSSRDLPIYRIIYPHRMVVPCGGSEEVDRAVAGLRGAAAFHWVDGRGILDGDARSPAEIAALAAKGIHVLPVNEVENLHYLPWIVEAIARQQAVALGEDAEIIASKAKSAAIASLKDANVQHLASENAGKILRKQVMEALPKSEELVTAGPKLSICLASEYGSQKALLESLIADGNFDEIVKRFSIRDSSFLSAVADTLRFKSSDDFEKAVRARLSSDPQLLARLRTEVGELPV